jgi:beta-N-acetylhexosaminidase
MTRSIAFLLFGCVAVASCGTSASTGQIEFGPGPSAPAAQTEVVATMATTTSGVTAAVSTTTAAESMSTVSATMAGTLATTTTTTTASATSTVAPSGAAVDLTNCVKELPLRERLALLVWPGVDADRWQRAVEAVRSNHLGGVVLMTAARSKEKIKSDLADIKAANPRGILIATDEEGGSIQRLSSFGKLASQKDMVQKTPTEVEKIVADHGKIIQEVGIDVVLGPVVDVLPPNGTSPIGVDRLFSDDPQKVSQFGEAYVKGWQSAGLLPVLKHFPGHGSSVIDTHLEAGSTPPMDSLKTRDLVPYKDLSKFKPAVMLSHLSIPEYTDGQPTSTSSKAIALLRSMGYRDELVITDALNMSALKGQGGVPNSAVLAIAAGADVALFPTNNPLIESTVVIDALEVAVTSGQILESAVNTSARRVATYSPRFAASCA